MIFSSQSSLSLRRTAIAGARLLLAVLLAAVSPSLSWACACGCSVFDVQTGGMLPTQPGGTAFLEYDFLNQKQNWSGGSKASDDDNPDKQLRTHFVTAGVQYMFDRSWGVSGQVPFMNRYFKTTDENGNIDGFTHNTVGDLQLKGIYTGFSSDMSSGLVFGLKLPTGDWKYGNFDRDTEAGTGSTDLLLGAYHQAALTEDKRWSWFSNVLWVEPTLIQSGYRPGATIDTAVGVYYDDWRLGALHIAPLAQAVGSLRWRDSGPAANSPDTGYQRLLLGPGVEIGEGAWHAFANVSFPVAQNINGDQIVASEYYKLSVSWSFY